MLKEDIGINAWTVWTLLSSKGKLSVKELCELTNSNDSFIFMTLGWLFKGNAVSFFIENDTLYAEMNNPFPEVYTQ